MMEDYEALNHATHIPLKHTLERTKKEVGQQACNEIRKEFEQQDEQTKKIHKEIYQDRNLIAKSNIKNSKRSNKNAKHL